MFEHNTNKYDNVCPYIQKITLAFIESFKTSTYTPKRTPTKQKQIMSNFLSIKVFET